MCLATHGLLSTARISSMTSAIWGWTCVNLTDVCMGRSWVHWLPTLIHKYLGCAVKPLCGPIEAWPSGIGLRPEIGWSWAVLCHGQCVVASCRNRLRRCFIYGDMCDGCCHPRMSHRDMHWDISMHCCYAYEHAPHPTPQRRDFRIDTTGQTWRACPFIVDCPDETTT